MKTQLKRRAKIHKYARPVIVGVGVFALMAASILILTRAATPGVPLEAESAQLSGNARPVDDASASGNKAVHFGASTSPVPTPPPPTPNPVDLILAAAGDIAQDSGEEKFTSDIIFNDKSIQLVLALGDNAYEDGTYEQYMQKYDPTWGRFKSITKPTTGNHEMHTDNEGYNKYFGDPPEYYDFTMGSWYFLSLNSEIAHDSGSAQVAWLKSKLAANTAKCVMAYWHAPRFSAGTHDDDSSMTAFWQALYDANADVVLNGHSHIYERFELSKPDGTVDKARGLHQFVIGTGGAEMGDYSHTVATRLFADAKHYGVIRMTLTATGYSWQFINAHGGDVLDQGTGACH